MHTTSTMIAVSGILLLGMACQWLAWRVKLPAIIFLLACGMLVGPVGHWIDPDALFGDLLFPFVSLAVAVILFEGSMTLRLSRIPGVGGVIRNLVTIGVAVTWVVTTVATHWLLAYPWQLAALFGAIMVVTGPTVIAPMLRTIRPRETVAAVLHWEGILVDPLGAVLAVLVYKFIEVHGVENGYAVTAVVMTKMLAIGLGLGALAGFAFGAVLKRYWIPKYLHNMTTLALVCGVFTLSNALQAESGLLTVTVMGAWLANMRLVELEDILEFKESLTLLLVSTLFIVLAARMDLRGFLSLGWGALGVFLAIQFVARPVSVQLSVLGSNLSMGERHLLAWIAPRGIVAAAISALFALKLEKHVGLDLASSMVPLSFCVILCTILLQSLTAGPIARRLGVAEPEPKGFLIVGGTPFALALAVELQKNGFTVQIADQDWSAVRAAVMQGLQAYWGNPVSEDADINLSLTGIGHLLAITPQSDLNALVAHYYRTDFEPDKIFTIRNQRPSSVKSLEKSRFKYAGRSLFDGKVSLGELEELLRDGAKITTTPLTSEFSYEQFRNQTDLQRMPFFAIDQNDRVFALGESTNGTAPKAGWKIMAVTAGGTGQAAAA